MNVEVVTNQLVEWLRGEVKSAGASGVVLGASGGVDSAVAAVIAQKAFPENTLALILPCESSLQDMMDAEELLYEFHISYQMVELDNAYGMLLKQFESVKKLDGDKGRVLRANIKPRLRMITLYYFAQAHNYLVLGTSNKSEINVGYATKHGDSGVDLQILADLYKDEVYKLARYLEVPDSIINKAPSGGLWHGQTDEEEMGISYSELDEYLRNREHLDSLEKIEIMIRRSEHKRHVPPFPILIKD